MAEYVEGENAPESEESAKSNDAILEEAKERFKLAEEAEKSIRKAALEDMEFAAGKQWDEGVLQKRHEKGRPALTINRMPQFIRQITNDQRQNRPSIKVHPVDDKADVETGKTIQGLIRHIEYNSGADAAYDQAVDGAARGGFGYLRVITDYVNPQSFEQEILIKRIRNPLSVFFDPYSKEPDGSDANFAFVVESVSKDEYKKLYPKSNLADSDEWDSVGNSAPDWMENGSARVAEYFYKKMEPATLCQLVDGSVVRKSELPKDLPEGTVVAERETQIPKICWVKLNACEVLAEREWAGQWIPIIPVYGEELDINGKRILKGVVRDAKDSQRMYNVWKSYETETIALAPKSPWLADAKTIEGHEAVWRTANTESHAYLPYNARPDAPPPQRQNFEPPVQAISQAAMLAAEDLKATTGIYDAAMGARSNETSGIAIQRRSQQAQTSNFHFTDNLTRSLRHLGRILVDLIPHIYDTERTARIIGEDGQADTVTLNGPVMKDGQPVLGKDGKPLIYDLTAGKYDVTIDVGPSFASKRQEAMASMMDFSKAVPQVAASCADLIVKNADWPGAQELAERIRKTLPPHLVDDPKQQQQIPPQVQAQLAQMQQMLEQASKDRDDLLREREQKLIEIESKERIEFKKLEVQLEIERAKLDAKDSLAMLNAEIASIEQRLSLLNMSAPIPEAGDQAALDQSPPMDGGPMPAGPMEEPIPTGGDIPPGPIHGDEP